MQTIRAKFRLGTREFCLFKSWELIKCRFEKDTNAVPKKIQTCARVFKDHFLIKVVRLWRQVKATLI